MKKVDLIEELTHENFVNVTYQGHKLEKSYFEYPNIGWDDCEGVVPCWGIKVDDNVYESQFTDFDVCEVIQILANAGIV